MFFKKKEEKAKTDALTNLSKEIDDFKREVRIMFKRLEDKVEKNHEETLEYVYSLSTLVDELENRLAAHEESLKKLDENLGKDLDSIKAKLDDIGSTISVNAESQMKMLNVILKRFTSLIGVVSDILRKQLSVAHQKVREMLEEERIVEEEKRRTDYLV